MANEMVTNVGGIEYPLTPMTAADWSEFLGWVRDNFMETVVRHVKRLPQPERIACLQAAALRLPLITTTDPETRAAMETREGVGRILWYSVRRVDASVTLEAVIASEHGG